jgi:GNAT superfamily N-acetyltransferase
VKARAVSPADSLFAGMKDQLQAAGLPTSDLLEGDAHYFAIEPHGFGGFVRIGEHALLRSIVVPEAARGRQNGAAILAALLVEARTAGCTEIWLLTTEAAEFFARYGFARVARTQAPAPIAETSQFKELCPQTAVLMYRQLLP